MKWSNLNCLKAVALTLQVVRLSTIPWKMLISNIIITKTEKWQVFHYPTRTKSNYSNNCKGWRTGVLSPQNVNSRIIITIRDVSELSELVLKTYRAELKYYTVIQERIWSEYKISAISERGWPEKAGRNGRLESLYNKI